MTGGEANEAPAGVVDQAGGNVQQDVAQGVGSGLGQGWVLVEGE